MEYMESQQGWRTNTLKIIEWEGIEGNDDKSKPDEEDTAPKDATQLAEYMAAKG